MKRILILLIFLSFGFYGKSQDLSDYFELASENNPGLKAKYFQFEAALQKVAQGSSLPDPNLSFGYFIAPTETRVGPQIAKFSLTQMFPWFGTLSAQETVLSLRAEAMYKDFLDERNKLFYNVSAAYYPIYEVKKLKQIEMDNIAILASYKEVATLRYENAMGSMVDVLRVDIMLNDAETNLSILDQQELPLISQFNALLNRPSSETITVNDTLIPSMLATDYQKDSLLLLNPKLAGLNLKIKASEASEEVAIKKGLPKMGVGLDYVIVGERPDVDFSDNGKDAFAAMVSVSIPIFRSQYKAAQQEAQLMQQSYALQKEDLSNRLLSSYDMAWFKAQKEAEYIQLYEKQSQESSQSLNLLFTSYANSGKDFEEVLRMEQQLLRYQKLKVESIKRYFIAKAELDYITSKTR
jgi:outer membrane protein TolC